MSGGRTCWATRPPSWLLSLPYLSSEEPRKRSNSSIDSGSGSAAGCLGADGGVETAEASGGEVRGWLIRAGTSFGSSVEVAMSSRRDVAASSLDMRLAQLVSQWSESTMAAWQRVQEREQERERERVYGGGWETVPLDQRRQVVHGVWRRHGG